MLNLDLNTVLEEEDVEPFIGQMFGTEEEACVFYRKYVERHGFAIHKDRFEKRHDKIVRRNFSYHQGRKRPNKVIDASKDKEIENLQCASAMLICE